MVDVYTSEAYIAPTHAQFKATVAEGLGYISAHTPATVTYTVNTDTDIDALIACGDRYFRVTLDADSVSQKSTLTLSVGRMVSGAYVSTASRVLDGLLTNEIPYYTELHIVNQGAMFTWVVYGTYGYGGQSISRDVCLSCVELRSGATNTVVYAGGVNTLVGSDYTFPSRDSDSRFYVPVSNGEATVTVPDGMMDYCRYNVPPLKILLFPALLILSTPNDLQVPTIGAKRVYYTSGLTTYHLYTFREFLVNNVRYVCLGNVAIRSD